jgi:Zn-dependent peptidase ImmA (M78 family)
MEIRIKLGLENVRYFPVVQLLELMSVLFPKFHFEVVEDDDLPRDVHADTDVENHIIRIKRSVYDGACNGNGRDRMTIAHEIGHYLLLCVWGFRFQRNFANNAIPLYQDPEWQAKCFAGELLIAAHLVKDMNPCEIMDICGVSMSAAETQWNRLKAS